jgi:hydrogenase maturation factor
MCISRPQRVLKYENGKALVEFMGQRKTVTSPEALKEGDFVLCQQNFVVRKIPEKTAKEMIREWREMNGWV